MSDVIKFPTNADQYYRKALSALKVHDFGRAQEFLIKSYETDPQVHVFEELIKLYIARGQKADLLNCWQTYFPDIEAVNDWNVLLLYGASLSLLYDLDAALLRLYQLQARFQAAGWDSEDLLPFIHQLNHTQRLVGRLCRYAAPLPRYRRKQTTNSGKNSITSLRRKLIPRSVPGAEPHGQIGRAHV